MNWEDERWIKVYVRDTVTWKLWRWQARFVFMSLLRKVDRAGVIDVGPRGVVGLAAVLEIPTEIVRDGMDQLVEPDDLGDATVVWHDTQVLIPRFIAAQEAKTSDAQRQRESRQRRADIAKRNLNAPSRFVTDHDASVTDRDDGPDDSSRNVTVLSRNVTKSRDPVTPRVEESRLEKSKKVSRAARRDAAPKLEGYQDVVDCFHRAYESAHSGHAPTWSAKTGAMIKRLIKAHGAVEVQRRIAVMFGNPPPAWPPGPYDIGVLVQHFDRFVEPPRANGTHVGRVEPLRPDDYANDEPEWSKRNRTRPARRPPWEDGTR